MLFYKIYFIIFFLAFSLPFNTSYPSMMLEEPQSPELEALDMSKIQGSLEALEKVRLLNKEAETKKKKLENLNKKLASISQASDFISKIKKTINDDTKLSEIIEDKLKLLKLKKALNSDEVLNNNDDDLKVELLKEKDLRFKMRLLINGEQPTEEKIQESQTTYCQINKIENLCEQEYKEYIIDLNNFFKKIYFFEIISKSLLNKKQNDDFIDFLKEKKYEKHIEKDIYNPALQIFLSPFSNLDNNLKESFDKNKKIINSDKYQNIQTKLKNFFTRIQSK